MNEASKIDKRILKVMAKVDREVSIASYVQDQLVSDIDFADTAREGVMKCSHRSQGYILAGYINQKGITVLDIYHPEQRVTANRVSFDVVPFDALMYELDHSLNQAVVGLALFDHYDGKASVQIAADMRKKLKEMPIFLDNEIQRASRGGIIVGGSNLASSVITETLERKIRYYREGPLNK